MQIAIQPIRLAHQTEKQVQVYMLRSDKADVLIPGNKHYKLKYNIEYALKNKYEGLLSFGGAYSNHILALAALGNEHQLPTIGVIRGEELGKDLAKTLEKNSVLRKAQRCGMKFIFVERKLYRNICKLNTPLPFFIKNFQSRYHCIPEGGSNELAVKGCEEMLPDQVKNFDFICVPMGTGGTLAGIANSCPTSNTVIGFPVLRNKNLLKEITHLLKKTAPAPTIINDYHFGGYGKISKTLTHWITDFERKNHIELDPLYTGKMMFGVEDLIRKGFFPKNTKILCVHTGLEKKSI